MVGWQRLDRNNSAVSATRGEGGRHGARDRSPHHHEASFGTTYRETWSKTGVVMGALTAVAVIAGYDSASSYGGIAFLIDGAFAFAIGFLTWGSLINLIVAAIRHNR